MISIYLIFLIVILVTAIIFMMYDVGARFDNTITAEDKKIFSMFREHDIYKKFKTMYPDSTEKVSPSKAHILEARYNDSYNNEIMLMMIFDNENYHYWYYVACSSDRFMKPNGGIGIEAFDYLENNQCILEE